MMMTTNQMNEMMQSFFNDYNGKNDEINRLNDELAAVKAELAKLGIEFDRVNIEFRKATEELEETRKKLAETEQELGETKEKLGETEQKLSETKEKLKIANAIIADIRPKERADFGIRSFEYLGKRWYLATDLLHKKGYSSLSLRTVLGNEILLSHARKFEYRSIYDRIISGKIRKAPRGEVWCVDEVGAEVILRSEKKECKPVSREMEDEIVELYKSGMSRHNIASKIGRSHSTVCTVLARNGQSTKRRYVSDNDVTEVIRLYESGMNRADIASHTGFCYEIVRRILYKNGYGRRKAV